MVTIGMRFYITTGSTERRYGIVTAIDPNGGPFPYTVRFDDSDYETELYYGIPLHPVMNGAPSTPTPLRPKSEPYYELTTSSKAGK